MVEHDLAKVGVASSSLVSRSSFERNLGPPGFLFFAGSTRAPGSECHAPERSRPGRRTRRSRIDANATSKRMARWQSGHAAACKAVYAGSIPTLASIRMLQVPPPRSASLRERGRSSLPIVRVEPASRRSRPTIAIGPQSSTLAVHRPRDQAIATTDAARVAKSVDARDLKSLGRKAMPVRVRPRAPVLRPGTPAWGRTVSASAGPRFPARSGVGSETSSPGSAR